MFSRTLTFPILCTALLAAFCMPLVRTHTTHVKLAAWTNDGEPLLLAQETKLKKTAYLVSPEGGGVFEDYVLGDVVLVRGKEKILVQPMPHPAEIRFEQAIPFSDRPGFLAVFNYLPLPPTNGSRKLCLQIEADGTARPCAGFSAYKSFFSPYLPPNGHELWFRQVGNDELLFESLDVETGRVTPIAKRLWQLPLQSPNDRWGPGAPFDMGYSRLSPNQDLLAVVTRETLWLLDDNLEPIPLHRFGAHGLPTFPTDDNLRELPLGVHDRYSLIWSPDQRFVYYCNGGDQAVLVAIGDQQARTDVPCVRAASWSSNGKQIVGVEEERVIVWTLADQSIREAF